MGKKYIKCPRCELNYILEGEDYCEVCKNEMKHHEEGDDDELLDFDDMELCPVCGTNYIREGQAMCEDCLAKRQAEGGEIEPATSEGDDDDALVSTDADEAEEEEYNSGYSEMDETEVDPYKNEDDDTIIEDDNSMIDFAGDEEEEEVEEEVEEAAEDDFDDIGNIDDIDDDEDEDEDDYDLDGEDMLSKKK